MCKKGEDELNTKHTPWNFMGVYIDRKYYIVLSVSEVLRIIAEQNLGGVKEKYF